MYKLIIMLAIATLFAITGCENFEGPQGPEGLSPISVDGYVQVQCDDDSAGYFRIYTSLPLPDSVVYLNDLEIPFSPGGRSVFDYCYSESLLPVACGDSVKMEFYFDDLEGRTNHVWYETIMPGYFEIDAPESDSLIYTVGEDLTVSWSPSSHSDGYEVHLYMNIAPADTSEYYYCSFSYHDEFYPDTTLTLTAEEIGFDPAEVNPSDWYNSYLYIIAYNGPSQEGDLSNVNGSAYGFIRAYSEAEPVFIVPVVE